MSGRIEEVIGKGGQPCINLRFGDASARVCLQGAHIDSYKPDGTTEVLWVSNTAVYAPGKSIRGGIPICWPWFGAHINRSDRPQHGFARVAEFALIASEETELHTHVRLKMVSECPFDEWRDTQLEVEISLSDQLKIGLVATNIGNQAIDVGAALHSYFQVADVSKVKVPELKGLRYKDKVRDFLPFEQAEDLCVQSETDRVYLQPPSVVGLMDLVASKTIQIESWGNTDLVVWNPWFERAKEMADFDDQGYKSMICIEPAIALGNKQTLEPKAVMRLGKSISIRPI